MGGAETDVVFDHDERRFFVLGFGEPNGGVDGRKVCAIFDFEHVPVLSLKTFAHVLGKAHRGRSVDRDPVVVVKHDEFGEFPVAGERAGFGGDTLHEAAVTADGVGVVIDDLVAGFVEVRGHVRLGGSKSHGVGDSLSERAGRRVDAGSHVVFGMAGGDAAP